MIFYAEPLSHNVFTFLVLIVQKQGHVCGVVCLLTQEITEIAPLIWYTGVYWNALDFIGVILKTSDGDVVTTEVIDV